MPRKPTELYLREEIPDICPKCGQQIDKRSRASIDHHSTPKHLPHTGGKRRSGWL